MDDSAANVDIEQCSKSNALEQCSNKGKISLEKKPVSLDTSGLNNASIEQCSKSNDSELWNNGHCEHCKQAFKKRTTWQRFCSPECREQAYFVKTGIKTGSLLKG